MSWGEPSRTGPVLESEPARGASDLIDEPAPDRGRDRRRRHEDTDLCSLRPALGTSFIVCCFNSSDRLPRTLEHLSRVRPPTGAAWEVVVVDNASTDATAAVARDCWTKAGGPAPLSIVSESERGLMYARLRGIRAARQDILCFVDDDNWIGEDWAVVLNELFARDPALGAAGGLGRPVFEGPAPQWFDSVQWAYAVGPQASASGEVPPERSFLFGAGLAVRRDALLDLLAGGFQPSIHGRRGAALSAGDDSELCFALTLAGWKLRYDSRLVFQHLIASQRLERDNARRLVRGLGEASAFLDAYVVDGAAARPRHWRVINRWNLLRLIISGAQCVRTFLPRAAEDRTFAWELRYGRFRGVMASWRHHATLCRSLRRARWKRTGRALCPGIA